VRGTNFQDDLFGRFADTAERVFCASSIVLFTNEQELDYKIWNHLSEWYVTDELFVTILCCFVHNYADFARDLWYHRTFTYQESYLAN